MKLDEKVKTEPPSPGLPEAEEGPRGLTRYVFWKAILERFVALLALVILSPFLALIALAISVDSPGGPLFQQERVGKDGRRFRIYKFRSMYKNNDDSKHKAFVQKWVTENVRTRLDENGKDIYQLVRDPRVTRVGTLLRKTNLDELPQLINVLKGEMAFIGPRPDIPLAVEMYKEHHLGRLRVRPGITGLWQLSGRRNSTFEDMVRLDIDYMNRQSPLLDAKIVLLTVREILTRDGR